MKVCKRCKTNEIDKGFQFCDPCKIEKERERGREKYERLGYKHKQKEWDSKRPWRKSSIYKNLHRSLKIPKGIAAHHWCYNDDKLKDIVLMDYKDHKQLHQLLELDIERRIFKVKATGEYLDSRNKHLNFIMFSGFGFVEYSKNINYTIIGLNESSQNN